jgi:predicted alpha/beta hydrolase family esterase
MFLGEMRCSWQTRVVDSWSQVVMADITRSGPKGAFVAHSYM